MDRSAPTDLHPDKHPRAGEKVVLAPHVKDPQRDAVVGGTVFEIEDWDDRLRQAAINKGNISLWDMTSGHNWPETHYLSRVLALSLDEPYALPDDDEIIYGKIGALGHCVHASEII